MEWFKSQQLTPRARFRDPKDNETYEFYGKYPGIDQYLFRETYQETEKKKTYYNLTLREFEEDINKNQYEVTEVLGEETHTQTGNKWYT